MYGGTEDRGTTVLPNMLTMGVGGGQGYHCVTNDVLYRKRVGRGTTVSPMMLNMGGVGVKGREPLCP